MGFQLVFDINPNIYLRDPESSELGRQIVQKGIDLIYELGFEQFTFRKLASEINSTEASIYRYFENKHRLLLYILNWYWHFMDFMVRFRLESVTDNKEKLKVIVQLLTQDISGEIGQVAYNTAYLGQIVIAESSKVYLIKDVSEINKEEVFKAYKDLCARIAAVISAYNPKYKFPKSLSTTLIETSHYQQFFSKNLPRLTDTKAAKAPDFTRSFLQDMLFKVLDGH